MVNHSARLLVFCECSTIQQSLLNVARGGMYDASLGYDPDEWEECSETEHFLAFSFFTRIVLATMAIAFVYMFLKLIDQYTNKGRKKKNESHEKTTSETMIDDSAKCSKISKIECEIREEVYQVPSTAEDLLKEAEEYMQSASQKIKNISHDVYECVNQTDRGTYESPRILQFQELSSDGTQQDVLNRGATSDEVQIERAPAPFIQNFWERRLSIKEERALMEWELEKEQLEAERLAKLQDREVGGDDHSEFTTSSRAIEHLLPASHISYHSISPPEGETENLREFEETTNNLDLNTIDGLERKLMTEIGELAGAAHDKQKNRNSYRDSELTDYDISDFHIQEHGYDGTLPVQELQFVLPGAAPVETKVRHTTGDSDDYVKVQVDPIDMPIKYEKTMSLEEAKQLQELYQEYDFGMEVSVPVADELPITQINSKKIVTELSLSENDKQLPTISASSLLNEAEQHIHQTLLELDEEKPISSSNARALIKQTALDLEPPPTYHISVKGIPDEDPKNIVDAEMFVQDALEYLGNQDVAPQSGGFVMEEEMLSSQGNSVKKTGISCSQTHPPSGDPTSQMIKTIDIFERVEHDEHDDMTYAPEIQSVEIPPDQMSENSENLQEYFDRVAAVGTQQDTLKPCEITKPISAQQAALAQAPHIVSASGKRAISSTSLASGRSVRSTSGISSDGYPRLRKQSSLLSVLGVTSMQEMLLTITSLDTLSDAMRKAGLESTNIIFGIDYTASNKYQGEDSFGGRSLHTIHPNNSNPYQQVITILGRTLAPFASTGRIPVFGFGDAKTGDWSVFPLKTVGECTTLDEVLKVYNEVTPTVDLSGPTNFAPLIYQAMEICQKANDYHILCIVADGQVTNERATRRAIVQACQYPLSIIVVGVGDGPWDMMKVFDESLPKRAWDNFHFVEFHEIMRRTKGEIDGDVKLAVQSLLEIPDQYRCICELGLLKNRSIPPRGSDIRKEMMR